jgi:glycerophosphoryl diester phosphodiesterase
MHRARHPTHAILRHNRIRGAHELKDLYNRVALAVVDFWMAAVPRRRPDPAAAARCRIVSHRGQHDGNRTARENTFEAFEAARAAGVWGIETDIRWTADLVPVLSHDPGTARVFGKPVTIAGVTFAELRAAVPELPSLAELVAEFGGNTHLMLELKAAPFPGTAKRQAEILRAHLAALRPGRDYHVLALDPALFEAFDIVPRSCCLSVAQDNMAEIAGKTLAAPYGGLTGHFLLLNDAIKRRHEQAGQKVGTGFVASRNCLYREIGRDVEWIFSDDAVALQKIVDELVATRGPSATSHRRGA